MDFNEKVKDHLAKYKKEKLGVDKNGIWGKNNKNYPHILPEELRRLNIIELYRKEFWEKDGLDLEKNGKLHNDFHHLNSSQAMCFNLFFPFKSENKLDLLFEVLNLDYSEVNECLFEKILDKKEQTHIDFYVDLNKDQRILFETKYTESDFGKADKKNKKYENKFKNTYETNLRLKISEKYMNLEDFCEHYQIFRNIFHIRSGDDKVFLIYPKQNDKLIKYNELLKQIMNHSYRDNLRRIHLEDFIDEIIGKTKNSRLLNHFLSFKEKYIDVDL
jgi:hypothetical protein